MREGKTLPQCRLLGHSQFQSALDNLYSAFTGDVSAVAPLHSEGVPCVAHLCNEAMIRSAVNVEYIHSTQGELEPGTERMYELRTVKPVAAGAELLADYGAKFPRTWSGMYGPKK